MDSVDGKNPKQVERRRQRKLMQLLARNDPPEQRRKATFKNFADPADFFVKQK